MSVFQLQEWWSVKLSDDEEFDQGCMAIGNIDNTTPSTEKICVGSQQGIIRIYHPTKPQFRVEDLLLEESLSQPILQLMIGRYIPSTELLGLAVLHPRMLCVYEVIPQGMKDGRANYYSLNKAYQHIFGLEGGKHFTAFNMTSGFFGGSKTREMIIVQSMDGKLQIFEQSANAFTRQLSDCLIPGPLAYLPKIDAFLTVTHATSAECYRYQVLASTQADIGTNGTNKSVNGFGLTTVRSALNEWSVLLGESCRQIVEGSFSLTDVNSSNIYTSMNNVGQHNELLMVCDKSLFLLKIETGSVMQQKRLERSDAACVCSYEVDMNNGNKGSNFILALQDSTIQVYSAFNLTWAAKTTTVPVQMHVGNFGNQKGLIVTIDEEGLLALHYLGTRPPINAVTSHVREMNYDKIDEEHRALLQVIRDSQTDQKVESAEKLLIRSQIGKVLDLDTVGDVDLPNNLVPLHGASNGANLQSENSFLKICVRLYLTYNSDQPATNVSVVVSTPNFVHAVPKNVILQKVNGVKATPIMVKIYLYAMRGTFPTGLDIIFTATYNSPKGEPRIASHTANLPLHIACRPRPPVKNAPCKIVLDTELSAQNLTDLFDDFLYAYQESGGVDVTEILGGNATQAMGFQIFGSSVLSNTAVVSGQGSMMTATGNLNSNNLMSNSIVSILVSKNAGRYRIQSESYPAMYLITHELERRLSSKRMPSNALIPTGTQLSPSSTASAAASASLLITCSDPLPMNEYFELIDHHLKTRYQLKELIGQLENYAFQYRLVQKRMLVRYKDRNPTPLLGLDTVLKETYAKMIELGDQVESQQNKLKQLLDEIHTFSKFLALQMSLKYKLSKQERSMISSFLCPEIQDGTDQGWEETVDASITYILKTSLAKTVKESATLTGTVLELPGTTESLKKHFNMFIERLEKGGKLSIPSVSGTTTSPMNGSNPSLSNTGNELNNPASSSNPISSTMTSRR